METAEYLRKRNEAIAACTVDEGLFSEDELRYYNEHTFRNDDEKSYYISELFYLRSAYCHLFADNGSHVVRPLTNDILYDESFVVSSIVSLVTGFNLVHGHDTHIQNLLQQLCEQVKFSYTALEKQPTMDAVRMVLAIKVQDVNLPAYEREKEQLDAFFTSVREDASILFMHMMLCVMNRCPFALSAEPDAFHLLVQCCIKAAQAMHVLMSMDCAGVLAIQLIQRFHECETCDMFEEFTSACRFLSQFLAESHDDVIPWCSMDHKQLMVAMEAILLHMDKNDAPLKTMSTSEMFMHLYVHLRWLRLVSHFLLPFMLEKHNMDQGIISMLLDICMQNPRAKIGVFIIFRLCYSTVGILPVLRSLILQPSDMTSEVLQSTASMLMELADHAPVIFSPFSPIGLTPEYQGFHRVIKIMTPAQREEVLFDEFFHTLHDMFMMYQIHGRFMKRTRRFAEVSDLSLDQEVTDKQAADQPLDVNPTLLFDDGVFEGTPMPESRVYSESYEMELSDDMPSFAFQRLARR